MAHSITNCNFFYFFKKASQIIYRNVADAKIYSLNKTELKFFFDKDRLIRKADHL